MRRKAQPTLWSSRRRAIDMGGRFLVVTTNTRPRSRYPVWRRVDRPHGRPASAVCGRALGGNVPLDRAPAAHRGDLSGGGLCRARGRDPAPVLPPARNDVPL